MADFPLSEKAAVLAKIYELPPEKVREALNKWFKSLSDTAALLKIMSSRLSSAQLVEVMMLFISSRPESDFSEEPLTSLSAALMAE